MVGGCFWQRELFLEGSGQKEKTERVSCFGREGGVLRNKKTRGGLGENREGELICEIKQREEGRILAGEVCLERGLEKARKERSKKRE